MKKFLDTVYKRERTWHNAAFFGTVLSSALSRRAMSVRATNTLSRMSICSTTNMPCNSTPS